MVTNTLKHAKLPIRRTKATVVFAIILTVIGICLMVLGSYGYAVNDLRVVNQDLYEEIKEARETARSLGENIPGTLGFLSEVFKTSIIIFMFGVAFALLGVMRYALPSERYKDFLCIVPALLFFLLFVYYPIADLLRISFTNMKMGSDKYKFVGIKNYKWLFDGSGFKYFVQSLKVTATYTLWEIVFTLTGGMLLALLFNRMSRSFNAMRTMVFMPKYIAVSTSAIVFIWILHGEHGILNHMLSAFSIEGPNWLNQENTALTGVLFLTIWRVTGYGMMIYLSAMKGIPSDYYEAASIDGADGVQRFRFITVPLLAPTTVFLFVTTFIASMKVFQSVDVMTQGGPGKATNVMVQWIYNLAFTDFRIDRAATTSVVFFVILLICTAITMKYSNRNANYDQ